VHHRLSCQISHIVAFQDLSPEGPEEESTHVPLPPLQTPVPTKPKPSLGSRSHTISARSKSTPMQELIRRVSSQPGSPFRAPSTVVTRGYSPYAKSSRNALSRIAPLHPNRRTPPLPPPPPPKPKKTKKQLDMEERWEMELEESVEGWTTLTDEERAALRRAKRDRELGVDD
jgi:hypothetical protein